MRKMPLILTLTLVATLLSGCTPASEAWTVVSPPPLPPTQNVLNPERGFYDGANVDLLEPNEDSYAQVRTRGLTLAYPDATWLPTDRDLTKEELDAIRRASTWCDKAASS